MQSVKTRCPLFPGFYNTLYEMDTESVCYNIQEDCDHDVGYDDIEWDNAGYEKAVCIEFVVVMEEIIKEIFPAIQSVEFVEEISPREYNFVNDKIEIEVKHTRELYPQIRQYLDDHPNEWSQLLIDNFKSRSGFSSFYDHTPEEWKVNTKNYTDFEDWNHLGTVLQLACKLHEDCEDHLTIYEKVMEGVYADEYAEYKGAECIICMDKHTKNKYKVCEDCEDEPDYVRFLERARDHDNLKHTPLLPGIDLEPVELIYNPCM